MRHIRQIAERGNLPKVDLMRKIPYGHRNTLQSEAFPWLIVQGFRLLRRFIPSLELRQAAVFYPVPVSMFAILILFLIGWRSFNLFAALLGSTALTSVPLFVNLFLNEEAGERFKLIYRDKENEVKIWEVSR